MNYVTWTIARGQQITFSFIRDSYRDPARYNHGDAHFAIYRDVIVWSRVAHRWHTFNTVIAYAYIYAKEEAMTYTASLQSALESRAYCVYIP